MAVRNWHSGSLLVIWIIGFALEWTVVRWRDATAPATAGSGGGAGEHAVRSAVGWAIVPIIEVLIPIALLVLTWLWVHGRHRGARPG